MRRCEHVTSTVREKEEKKRTLEMVANEIKLEFEYIYIYIHMHSPLISLPILIDTIYLIHDNFSQMSSSIMHMLLSQ